MSIFMPHMVNLVLLFDLCKGNLLHIFEQCDFGSFNEEDILNLVFMEVWNQKSGKSAVGHPICTGSPPILLRRWTYNYIIPGALWPTPLTRYVWVLL